MRVTLELLLELTGLLLTLEGAPAPELISLAGLEGEVQSELTLVYPDPPIGTEEQRLFETIAPSVKLRSLTEWVAQSGVQA